MKNLETANALKNTSYDLEFFREIKKRKRVDPQTRQQQLLIAYIGMVIGELSIASDNPPCYLTIGHTDIADASEVSPATVFNYFNTVQDLHSEIEGWALANGENLQCHESRRTACIILMQYAAVFPDLAAKNNLTVAPFAAH